jgi:hypothetical protein
MLNNIKKKSQVSVTMTWIIATLIIISLIVVSMYASSILAKKRVNDFKQQSNVDLIAKKNMVNFLLTQENGEEIYYKLQNGEFDENNGELAKKIFSNFGSYKNAWLGFEKDNNYFGEKPGIGINEKILMKIQLSGGKELELILVK